MSNTRKDWFDRQFEKHPILMTAVSIVLIVISFLGIGGIWIIEWLFQ